MKKIGGCLILLMVLAAAAEAGILPEKVELADLSQLSSEALETLKDSEFRVFLAKVRHAEKKVFEKQAKEDMKPVKETLNARRLQLKAAKAELKDIEQRSAGKKLADAKAALRSAQKAFDLAELHVEWTEKAAAAQTAAVGKAKAAIELAEAERDLARVSKLHERNAPSAAKYNLDEFKARIAKKQKNHETAGSRLQKAIEAAKTLKNAYESRR